MESRSVYDGLSDGGFACAFFGVRSHRTKDTFLTKFFNQARWSKKVRL